jgi:hypothetical protein
VTRRSAEDVDDDRAATVLVVGRAHGRTGRLRELEPRLDVVGALPRALTLAAQELVEDVRRNHAEQWFTIRAARRRRTSPWRVTRSMRRPASIG